MNTRLRDAIHALLSDHLRGLLLSAPIRMPVLGSTSIARPGFHDFTIPEWPKLLTLLIQHGLEIVDLTDLVSFPSTTESFVYPGQTIDAFYSGDGWEIPDSDPSKRSHSVGLLSAISYGGSPPVWVYDWPREGATSGTVDPPTLTSGRHPSLHGAGATALQYLVTQNIFGGYGSTLSASAFTGRARALVQAWRGAGLSAQQIADRLPADWSTAPGTLGLFYDTSAKTYWIANVDITGLRVCKMASGDVTAGVKDWLDTGVVSGLGADLALAYVLADLRAVDMPITLIDAETMAPAYAGQGTDNDDTYAVFVDDAVPAGSTTAVDPVGVDSWTFYSSPTPSSAYSGTQYHKSTNASGFHQHYFYGATTGVSIGYTDSIVQWVWIPSPAPREIMLSFNDGTNFEHRAYWGENLISAGTNGTASRMYIGAIPSERNQWVRLTVPAHIVDLAGKTLKGVAYSVYDAWVAWDYTAVLRQGGHYAQGDAWPIQQGWAFSPTSNASAIINLRTANGGEYWEAHESAQSTVAVTFANGVPTASLSVGSWAKFRPRWGYHKFWSGTQGAFGLLRNGQLWPGNDDCASSAPVVCWYEGGTLKTISYYKTTEATLASLGTTGSVDNLCSAGGTRYIYSGSGARVTGGFGFSRPAEAYIGGGEVTTDSFSVSGGTAAGNYSYGTNAQNAYHIFTYSCGLKCSGSYYQELTLPPGQTWRCEHLWGTGDADHEVLTLTGGGFLQILVYDTASPDVIWIAERRSFATKNRYKQEWRGIPKVAVGATMAGVSSSDFNVVLSPFLGQNRNSLSMGTGENTCGNYGLYGTQRVLVIETATEYKTKDATETASNSSDVSTTVRINGTEINAGSSWDPWDGALSGTGQEPAAADLTALVSALGDAVYKKHPGANLENTLDLDIDPPANHVAAMQWVGMS